MSCSIYKSVDHHLGLQHIQAQNSIRVFDYVYTDSVNNVIMSRGLKGHLEDDI